MTMEQDPIFPPDEPIIPDKFKILSGSALKVLAVVAMLIDHSAAALLANSDVILFSFAGRSLALYQLMRRIGRIAFPIFCFLLVEGFLHTRDRCKYGINLFAFALISEIPWNLLHQGRVIAPENMNVFFTLLLGYLGLCSIEYFKDSKEKTLLSLLCLLATSVVLDADYGCSGYGFILLLYVLREEKLLQAILGSCFLSSRWIAGLAFIPINLYNSKRGFIQGKFAKYAFYAVYPVHMLLLYLIKHALTAA